MSVRPMSPFPTKWAEAYDAKKAAGTTAPEESK